MDARVLTTPPHEQTQASEKRDPPGVLTWRSAAERNKLLIPWRLAVSITFAEQPRCLRVAWMLDHLFNTKTGFCNASNTYLAKFTGLPANKVQEALDKLEKDGAIRRLITPPTPGNQRRSIRPPPSSPSWVGGHPFPVGVTRNPQQPGVQILRRRPRMPKTQFDYARLAAEARHNGSARDLLGPAPSGGDVEPCQRHQKGVAAKRRVAEHESAAPIATFNASEVVWEPISASEWRH